MSWKLFSLCSLFGSLWYFFHEMLPVPVSPDEPLIPVSRDGKMGFITSKGQVALSFNWEVATGFDTENMAAVKKGSKWGWINRAGNVVIELQWDGVDIFNGKGLAQVRTGKGQNPFEVGIQNSQELKYEWIDRTGKVISSLPPETRPDSFKSSRAEPKDLAGMELLQRNDKWGWKDRTGKVVIEPQWDNAEPFDDEGMAQVGKDGKRGCIDRTGKVIIPLEWDSIGEFEAGNIAPVVKNGKIGWIDRRGKAVIAPQWDQIMNFRNLRERDFSDRDVDDRDVIVPVMKVVVRDGKLAIVDLSGKLILDPAWDYFIASQGVTGEVGKGFRKHCFLIAYRIQGREDGMIHRMWSWLTKKQKLNTPPSPIAPSELITINPSELCVCYDSNGKEIWRSDWKERDRMWGTVLGIMAVGTFFWGRRRGRVKVKTVGPRSATSAI